MNGFVVCENVIKIYRVADLEVVALQGIDLSVQQGEILALIGASGSGKSTLMNILGGLDRPSAGVVRVGERELSRLSPRQQVIYRREGVGFVWQQTARNLIPYLNAQQNVELPMALSSLSSGERRRRARDLLAQVGLEDRMEHRPDSLSGGQQQRVAIAVAMANRPALLLADEPTGQVDSESAATIFEALRRLNEAYNVTVIIVTHDPNVAERADRVIGMRDGRTISEYVRGQHGEGERILVDRGGRLQLPDAFLEHVGVVRQMAVHIDGERITLMPVNNDGAAHE